MIDLLQEVEALLRSMVTDAARLRQLAPDLRGEIHQLETKVRDALLDHQLGRRRITDEID